MVCNYYIYFQNVFITPKGKPICFKWLLPISHSTKPLEEPAVDMLHTVTGECSVLLSGVLLPGQRKGRPKALAWLQRPPPGGFPAPASQMVLGLSRQQPDIRSFNSTLTLPAPGWHNPTVCGLGPSHYRSGGVGCRIPVNLSNPFQSPAGAPPLQLPALHHAPPSRGAHPAGGAAAGP